MKVSFRTWFLGITTLVSLLVFAASTYAWFTTNKDVSTSSVTSRTGDESIELELSKAGGGRFRSENRIDIPKVNKTDNNRLMPVSTDNLSEFVYVNATVAGDATSFKPVDNEKYYYHGRIYMRARSTGMDKTDRLALYLDKSDGLIGRVSQGNMLNAARLGLKFDDKDNSTYILRLSESANPTKSQVYNTVINGSRLGDGKVLGLGRKNQVYAADDPSEAVSDYTVKIADNTISIPKEPLLLMEFNKIYTLDIYFYLEGCDPDCSSGIELNESDLNLAFYGILDES